MGSLDALQTLQILLFAIGRAGSSVMTRPPTVNKISNLIERFKKMIGGLSQPTVPL